jgi:ATP-dependent Clp protease adapter protein ClpS
MLCVNRYQMWPLVNRSGMRVCPKNNFHANFTALEVVIDFIKQIFRQNRHFSDRLMRLIHYTHRVV